MPSNRRHKINRKVRKAITYWGLSQRSCENRIFQRARSWPQPRTGKLIIDMPEST